jgi:hypothetical protein
MTGNALEFLASDTDLGLLELKPGASFTFALFSRIAGVLADPPSASPVLTLRHVLSGTTVTPAVAHDAVGTWHADAIIPSAGPAGVWVRRWQSTGAAANQCAILEKCFVVRALDF